MNAITIEDVPVECRDLALYLGIEDFIDLCFAFEGEQIYLPSIGRLHAKARNKRMIAEYKIAIAKKCKKSSLVKAFAEKYGISERTVRNILRVAKTNTESERMFE